MPSVSLDVILLAGRAAFLVFSFALAAITFVRWRRATQRDSAAAAANAQLILERLATLEAAVAAGDGRIAALSEQFERHLQAGSAGTAASYRIAIRLARSGASRDELMSGCGLTPQEAELVARLHGQKPSHEQSQAA